MSDAITDFFTAWSVEDETARTAQLDSCLSDTVFYADPRTDAPVTDPTALKDYVGMFSKMAPGMPVTVANISKTLEFTRATVQFGAGDQAQLGQYIIEADAAGKLTRIIGFVGLGAPE